MGLCQQLNHVSLPVFVLVMLFSMSTWIDVVGIWVELPLLVNVLPEGWGLPAFLTIIIQCANIGPATYALVYKFRSKSLARNSFLKTWGSSVSCDVVLTFVIIIVTTLSIVCMSFSWKYTVIVAGVPHSVPLFILVSFTALVSCMSSVVFLPYMARFHAVYITAYYIGQGLSGLVPGFAGLLQGLGQEPICINQTVTVFNITSNASYTKTVVKPEYKPPLFSVDVFFGFISGLLCISLVSFYILNFTEFCKREMISNSTPSIADSKDTKDDNDQAVLSVALNSAGESQQQTPESETRPTVLADSLLSEAETDEENALKQEVAGKVKPSLVKLKRFILLLTTVGIVNAMTNGILPATQSYTCLPFGSLVYTLSVRLSSVASPLASLSSMFLPRPSLKVVIFLTALGVSISTFHLTLAAQSPVPVLKGKLAGEIIVILSSVVMAASYSFVRVSVAAILREEGGRRELLWCGGITQIGSFCGALVTFLLVQVFKLFTGLKPCS